MKTIVGFLETEEEKEIINEAAEEQREEQPILSLVKVSFNNGYPLTYLNENFELEIGDVVFVNGSNYGIPGIVTHITTKFKADKSKLKKIIGHPNMTIKGDYEKLLNFMISTDDMAVGPEQFKSWIIAPNDPDCEDEEEIVFGEGYEATLEIFEEELFVPERTLDRAIDYLGNGNLKYISLIDGIGKAFIQGKGIYEITFKYENGKVFDMYCDCPFGDFCKHEAAVLIALRTFFHEKDIENKNFVAINDEIFWDTLKKCITHISV